MDITWVECPILRPEVELSVLLELYLTKLTLVRDHSHQIHHIQMHQVPLLTHLELWLRNNLVVFRQPNLIHRLKLVAIVQQGHQFFFVRETFGFLDLGARPVLAVLQWLKWSAVEPRGTFGFRATDKALLEVSVSMNDVATKSVG